MVNKKNGEYFFINRVMKDKRKNETKKPPFEEEHSFAEDG